MRTCLAILAVAAAALLHPTARAAGQVEVQFVNPQSFTDAAELWVGNTDNLAAIAGHLQRLGQKYLADGQVLRIQVLDIDLAGRARPTRWLHRTRVTDNPLDWPRLHLRYALESGGRLLRSGEQSIADLDFQSHLSHDAWQELGIEKRMLADWFRSTFGPQAGP